MDNIQEKNYKLNELFFNSYKSIYLFVFLFLPLLLNIVFNLIFHFDPNKALAILNNPDPVVNQLHIGKMYLSNYLIFTVLQFLIFLFFFCMFIIRFKSYFIKSGAMILPLYYMVISFVLPIIFGVFILGSTNGIGDNIKNIILTLLQILFYGIIIYVFFKYCTHSSFRNKSFFKNKNGIDKYNWTKIIFKKWKHLDMIKIILVIGGGVVAFYISSIILGNLQSTKLYTSENQQSINNFLRTTSGKILLPFLIIIFAPVMEEISCRQSPILSTLGSYDNPEYLKDNKISFVSIPKFTNKKIIYLIISFCLSMLFFANMHVDFSNMSDIGAYMIASFVFTLFFVLGDFNANYSIAIHSITNIISLVLIFQ